MEDKSKEELMELAEQLLAELKEINEELTDIRVHQDRLRKTARKNRQDIKVLAMFLVFLVVLVAIGAKYKNGAWEWELSSDGVVKVAEWVLMGGGTAAGVWMIKKGTDQT